MPADRTVVAQRVIVTQLLRDDHPVLWTRPELEAQMRDIDQQTVVNAVAILGIEGVLWFDERAIWAGPSTRHLDTLGLISI